MDNDLEVHYVKQMDSNGKQIGVLQVKRNRMTAGGGHKSISVKDEY